MHRERWALRRARDERGNALVEAVIIIPLLMLLTFGGIEFGIGFSQKGGLESVARAGARTAATETDATDNVAHTQIGLDVAAAVNAALAQTSLPKVDYLYVYRLHYNGADWTPDGYDGTYSGSCGLNCIRFTFSGSQFDPASATGQWAKTAVGFGDACGPHPDRVGVAIHGKFQFLTGLVGSGDIELKEKTILQLEPTNC